MFKRQVVRDESVADRPKFNIQVPVVRMTGDADCAMDAHCFPIHGKRKKLEWIDKHDLFVCDDRVYTLVSTKSEVFFMDAITGSLYQFGECLTSTVLKTRKLIRNRDLAITILFSAHEYNGPGDVEIIETSGDE